MYQTLHIAKGSIEACYVFEVGEAIDLSAASKYIENDSRRQIQSKRRSSERYFGYDPAPIIAVEITDPFIFNLLVSDRSLEFTIFDFGVILARYKIPIFDGIPLQSLVPISVELSQDDRLEIDARSRVLGLVDKISPAISNPYLEDIVQGYYLYSIESFKENIEIRYDELISQHGNTIAQILRQESETLSSDVIRDVFSYTFSYTPSDVTIIDWNAAMRFGPESRDILGVIEFALVQLLEMMYLDEKIDDHNDNAYRSFSSKRGEQKINTTHAALAQITVDSTHLAMSVTNAINLIGDPTLVKIYEIASQRFRLRELELNIEKKTAVLEGIYQKYTDRYDTRRALILEVLIVLLISFEIIQGLLK